MPQTSKAMPQATPVTPTRASTGIAEQRQTSITQYATGTHDANTNATATTPPQGHPTDVDITETEIAIIALRQLQSATAPTTPLQDHAEQIPNSSDTTSTSTATTDEDFLATRIFVRLQANYIPSVLKGQELTIPGLRRILNTTIAHHLHRTSIITFKIERITYLNTDHTPPSTHRPTNPTYIHWYSIEILPAATEDQFDQELYEEQVYAFVLQQWHKHTNDQFLSTGTLPPRTATNPPSPLPWAAHLLLHLPAVNHHTDTPRGCLLGLPADIYGSSRHHCRHILRQIHNHITPHIPLADPKARHYSDWDEFQTRVGLRPAWLTSKTSRAKSRIYFICTSSAHSWDTFLQFSNDSGPMKIYGSFSIITPWPTDRQQDDIILRAEQHKRDLLQ